MLQDKRMIDIDGQVHSGQKDPPGQSSKYIPPGDAWKEKYRLSTFVKYPQDYPVIATRLAANGFYYTGFKDRVKCFSCGLCVENWVLGDDPAARRWHSNDCELANGRDLRNEPIETRFILPTISLPNQASKYNQATNCRQASTSRNPETIPLRAAQTNNYHHGLTNGISNTTVNSAGTNRVNLTPEKAAARERRELFPCHGPVYPHMQLESRRRETFLRNVGTQWPSHRLRATIEQIVQAGFYYLGERDRVKCWYCNGGLQNWEYDDDPWVEHAKWFPNCEYTLREKGPEFVEDIVSRYPDLDRPQANDIEPMDITPPNRQTPPPPQPTQAINLLENNEAFNEAINELQYVNQARLMGYSNEIITGILKRKYRTNHMFYNTNDEFFEALFSCNHSASNNGQSPTVNTSESQSATTSASASNASQSSTEAQASSSSLDELQRLEETRMCRVCKSNVANVVLIPCGHLSMCESCSNVTKKCKICNRVSRDRIKIFRS